MFALAAAICFILAVFGVVVGINLLALGLFFVALALLIGPWPWGAGWVPGRR